MRRPLPGNGFAPGSFWQRIDRACARIIPYLVVVAIGLTVLNLIALAVGSRHVPVTRRPAGMVGAPAEAGCGAAPGIDAALRAGS